MDRTLFSRGGQTEDCKEAGRRDDGCRLCPARHRPLATTTDISYGLKFSSPFVGDTNRCGHFASAPVGGREHGLVAQAARLVQE